MKKNDKTATEAKNVAFSFRKACPFGGTWQHHLVEWVWNGSVEFPFFRLFCQRAPFHLSSEGEGFLLFGHGTARPAIWVGCQP